MARLAAIAKALYYPTSDDVTARIVRTITVRAPAGQVGRILDVCAGEGRAVSALAAAWGFEAYGVELDAERAEVARPRMRQCLRGSYTQLHASEGSFHVLFCNPPYDVGQDGEGNSVRLEVLFLQAATVHLAPNGLLVLIVPRAILRNTKFKEFMQGRYYGARVFDYPLPEREKFDQVVVLARRSSGYSYANPINTEHIPVIGDEPYTKHGEVIDVSATSLDFFALHGINPFDLAPAWGPAPTGAYATPTWDALVGHAGNKIERPLMPPRPGHQAMLLAAGALNGAEIRGCYLIKGSSEKVTDTIVEEDKAGGGDDTVVDRERVASRLAVLDLRTGDFDAWRVSDAPEKTAAWFQEYGADLAQATRKLHTPEFDGNLAPYANRLVQLHAPGLLPGHAQPEILQVQKEAAAAVCFQWRGSPTRKPHKTAILSGEMGTGKAQPLTAKVLTPTGWRTMGALRVGDSVIDPDGGTATIEGVFPQGVKPVYRVTFCDGSSTECCDDHLWLVNTPLRKWRDQAPRVLPLREIRERLHHANGNRQHFIPLVAPVEFEEVPVLLDPYLLGVLLGDGGLTSSVRLSTGDQQILRLIEPLLPPNVSIAPVKNSPYDYSLVVERGQRNPVTRALRRLDLFGKRSEHKFVPPLYLYNSVEVRVALLQGLLDTDGGIANERGTGVEYTSVSIQLARHVRELAQSLGGVVTMAPKETTYVYNGERRQGQTAYRLYITLPPDIQPFRLARKLATYSPGTKYGPSRSIENVDYVRDEECQCIRVSSRNSLYVTDDYIVTHNTSMAAVAVELYGARRTVVVCPAHLVRKWIREFEAVTGQRGVAVAGKKLSDVDAFFRSTEAKPARYLVISKEIAKLGTRWEPAFVLRTRTWMREVPDHEAMDALPFYARRTITKQVRQIVSLVSCPQCGRTTGYTAAAFDRDNHQYCAGCRSPLWTVTTLNDKGSTRWPLAEYISQRYARRYVLVVDECFPGASLVSTSRGRIPIKDIRVGDLVWSRTRDGQVVLRRVVRALCKPRVKPMVRVSHETGSIVCTDDHKIWTEDQLDYRKARCLTNTNVLIEINDADQGLPYLQVRVPVRATGEARAEDVQPDLRRAASSPDETYTQASDASVPCDVRVVSEDGTGSRTQEGSALLQSVVYPACGLGAQSRSSHPDTGTHADNAAPARGEEAVVGVDDEAQQKSRGPSEDERSPKGSSVLRSQGRERIPHTRAEATARPSGLGDGGLHPDDGSILANGASGPHSSDPEDRGGMRRSLPPHEQAAQPGPTEESHAPSARVDRAAVLELGGHDEHRPRPDAYPGCRGVRVTSVEPVNLDEEWVYDLEVEDTHCYFVEGILVSNCHKFAGAESDQSRAVQDLAAGAHKILAMTGTLYGGRASSLFYLLYKVEPSFRKRYGFKDCARFSQHFGLFETRYDLKSSTSRYGTRRGGKRSGGRTREIPGMNPAMVPLLLPYTIFVKLKDLRQDLPPYDEEVRIVDHDPAILRAIAELTKEVRKVMRKYPKVLGQYLQTCLGYPDCPEQAEEIWGTDEESGRREFLASAPAFPRTPQPKDAEVVRIVREEKQAGRQVLVFFAQTHKRDARGRVREALEAEGFRVEVLDASVSPEKREEWLEKACKRGFDVLLTNGRLVETGLDLLFAKTIIQYGTEYSVPILRQSVRRSWRLGQVAPIRVVFLAYRATMQEVAMRLIARKMRAAEMVDGDETGGLADFDSTGANFFVELAQEAVAQALAANPSAP